MDRTLTWSLACAVLLAACSLPAAATAAPPTQVPAPSATPTPASASAPPPSPTARPYPNAVLKIVGEEEIVFDWTTDRCERENIPDLAARAFRDAGGQVHLIISHYV
ncbi:MAG: hypothetical protein OEZ02_07030, partial [Anaerolineae bacterium]|nr:hypothetical protein [Anaerolineae bacterium]